VPACLLSLCWHNYLIHQSYLDPLDGFPRVGSFEGNKPDFSGRFHMRAAAGDLCKPIDFPEAPLCCDVSKSSQNRAIIGDDFIIALQMSRGPFVMTDGKTC